ncbi:hypothetical protein YC2023_022281 [Brassica napus]
MGAQGLGFMCFVDTRILVTRCSPHDVEKQRDLGSIIHGIDPDHVWFGGYMTQGNGFGGEWIYGDEFPDEECMRKHDRIQVSSQWAIMLNNQTDLSSSPTRRRPRITTKNRRTLRSDKL